MTQFTLQVEKILRGKMIILKDVTHLTETEARIRELNTILTVRADASDEELFSIGYTTKENGHGFGLYSCLLYIKEMDGELDLISAGKNRGAEFLIKLPCRH